MEKLYLLTHENTDPYFNIASEEYLLTEKKESFIYLWKNAPSVIVGRNQNTLQEVNLGYTTKKGIKTVRRLTGGGAVYHDLNNVNYTVITPYDKEVNSYLYFTTPIIEYLNSIGINADFTGRNDITIDGKKISGNAQTIKGDRILHHGTLLFKSDLDALTNALKPNKVKMESKGIKSVRSRVTNISEYLGKDIGIDEFYQDLINYFKKNTIEYKLTEEDIKNINKLASEKYSTYEWNIGKSPKGKNRFDGRFNFGTITITFDTIDGKLKNVEIFGDYFAKKDLTELSNKLCDIRFSFEDVKSVLVAIDEYIEGADGEEIAKKIFE